MKFLVTFRPNWWIIGAIFEEICIYVEENEGFGQPLIPFILLIGELQMGPYMVTYWCVSECCSLIGSHRLYVYRNGRVFTISKWLPTPPKLNTSKYSFVRGFLVTKFTSLLQMSYFICIYLKFGFINNKSLPNPHCSSCLVHLLIPGARVPWL